MVNLNRIENKVNHFNLVEKNVEILKQMGTLKPIKKIPENHKELSDLVKKIISKVGPISSPESDAITVSEASELSKSPEPSNTPDATPLSAVSVSVSVSASATISNPPEPSKPSESSKSVEASAEAKSDSDDKTKDKPEEDTSNDLWRCVWKKCPKEVESGKKYSLSMLNLAVAKFTPGHRGERLYCTIIGSTPIPLGKQTQWYIKILRSYCNNGHEIFTGVAPADIDQNAENCDKCGWYFNCCDSTLHSGPPHNYKYKEYGPKKEKGEYVHTGTIMGVVMDASKGQLSFMLDGVNFGVAYDAIPLDKPVVPCVILYYKGDSVELI